jgi:hypothetical protein
VSLVLTTGHSITVVDGSMTSVFLTPLVMEFMIMMTVMMKMLDSAMHKSRHVYS